MAFYGDYPVGTWFVSPKEPRINHVRLKNGYLQNQKITEDTSYPGSEVYHGFTAIVFIPLELS